MGDRIAVLRKGVLQQLGTPEELYDVAGQPLRRRVHRLAADERASARRSSRGSELVVGSQRLELPAGALDGFPALAGADAVAGRPGHPPGEPARRRHRRPVAGRASSPTSSWSRTSRRRSWCTCGSTPSRCVTDATLEIAKDIDAAAVEELRSLGKGSVLNARMAGTAAVREGTRAEFAVPPSALHFFDLATGEAITRTSRLTVATA